MSEKNSGKRLYRSRDDGEERGDIRVDDGRHGFRSQENSHSSSINCGLNIDVDRRGAYMYHTSHYYSHSPGGHGRLLRLSSASRYVHESLHENETCDIRGDDRRRIIGSQETRHY